jgi:N-acetylglucosaminyldiphosphoundecaprenol N-acetyl-beta-D-mannosaminyltransferase
MHSIIYTITCNLLDSLACLRSPAPPYKKQFSDADNAQIVAAVNAAHADVLWIGLGAPKQEKWAHQNRLQLNVKLIGPIGGVFDFFTDRVKLPPKWIQRFGMISIYRLCQEPRRLWRRNVDSPIFISRVIWQAITGGR